MPTPYYRRQNGSAARSTRKETMKLNKCPYDDDGTHELVFVELKTEYFENAIAVECLTCGCRGMAANAEDGEEMAATLWNELNR